ncbi:hypothetical protein WJX73_010192 [Symbiochloris irregularis]|uniref:Thioredoxin domain-containing protein n=1 Tax=Symbiochloris irregularis TaxID=706552 RepID=A0AAW1P1S1_9CHLO
MPQSAARSAGMPCVGVGAQLAPVASTSGREALQGDEAGFLDSLVKLPGGYRTSRRELLKTGSLASGLACVYIALSRAKRQPEVRALLRKWHVGVVVQLGILAYVASAWSYWRKAFSFASPKGILRALLPHSSPADQQSAQTDMDERIAAFKAYLAEVEGKGGGDTVPEFPAGATWFNAPPLKLGRELRGRVVLLDFWTYCCINCMHVLPDLAALEQKYRGRPVTVVGVHSAKFDNEKDDTAIRSAVLKYDITHPCVNDSAMTLWRDLGISSWPTFALVSPRGKLLTLLPGEGQKDNVDAFIAAALELYGERGQLDTSSQVPVALERDKDPALAASPLRFPGKLCVDAAGDRLFISDSNNHRIAITDLQGTFLAQVGGNGAQLIDGSFTEAAFNRPQGVAYSQKRDCLYVADTENHALREVDLKARRVRTLVGNGAQGRDYQGGDSGRGQQLSSPWDLVLDKQESVLFLALAGQHQIWRVDLSNGTAQAFSGDGSERNANATTGAKTSWAQPSGLSLAVGGEEVWVADSESSCIRSMSVVSGAGKAHVGGDPVFSDNLFKFGDKDGQGTGALLQHPLAVAALQNGRVLVADSYNHRLKVLDPATNTITTLCGNGKPGLKDGAGKADVQFSEPGGLAVGPGGDSVFVADTNNSQIRILHLGDASVTTLQLKDVPPPRQSAVLDAAAASSDPPRGATVVHVPDIRGNEGTLQISLALPAGYHYTQGANSSFSTLSLSPSAPIDFKPASGSLESGDTMRQQNKLRAGVMSALRD